MGRLLQAKSTRGYVISSSGTVGDILPLLPITKELVERGYPVTFLTSRDHSGLVTSAGAEFIEVYDPDWPHDRRDDVEFWRSVILPGYHSTMRYLVMRAASGHPLHLIARAGNWAFQTFSELYKIRYLRIFLSPSALNLGRWMSQPFRSMLDSFRNTWGVAEQGFNSYRTNPGGPSICLFPDWFGEPETRLSRAGASVGFTFYDRPSGQLPPHIAEFLTQFGSFVLFSASSGQADGTTLRESALKFSRDTGVPALLLSSGPSSRRHRIADRVMWCGRIPHEAIISQCTMMIHNGGIGTVARCVRAAIPQMIVPLRYDQPDNARRVQALGLGLRIGDMKTDVTSISDGYSRLVSDPDLPKRLKNRAEMVRNQNATASAVEEILALSS